MKKTQMTLFQKAERAMKEAVDEVYKNAAKDGRKLAIADRDGKVKWVYPGKKRRIKSI